MKFVIGILLFVSLNVHCAKTCNYSYSVWNVPARKSLRQIKVKKKYSELTEKEFDSIGCSPCEEDQRLIILNNGKEFKLCYKLASKVEKVLNMALEKGFKMNSVLGYRAQMSRGDIDEKGDRTVLSNHSFGSAVDINRKSNGLYNNCFRWDPRACRLSQGGAYNPSSPLSIKAESFLVKKMKEIGFKWGGEIPGKQKDFMHFSLSGF